MRPALVWGADPEAEPELVAVLAEGADAVDDEHFLGQICDAHDIAPGPLLQRLHALLEAGLQQRAKVREAQRRGELPEVAADVLDSLVGCELSARQLVEDTGRTLPSVHSALDRLRWQRLVSRERRGRTYVYRATRLGRQVARGGGR